MEWLSCSLFIDKSQFDNPTFRDVRRMVRFEIVDKLIAAGRSTETIAWLEGPYILGKPFPLGIEFGPDPDSTMYRIVGGCYIPLYKIKLDQIKE